VDATVESVGESPPADVTDTESQSADVIDAQSGTPSDYDEHGMQVGLALALDLSPPPHQGPVLPETNTNVSAPPMEVVEPSVGDASDSEEFYRADTLQMQGPEASEDDAAVADDAVACTLPIEGEEAAADEAADSIAAMADTVAASVVEASEGVAASLVFDFVDALPAVEASGSVAASVVEASVAVDDVDSDDNRPLMAAFAADGFLPAVDSDDDIDDDALMAAFAATTDPYEIMAPDIVLPRRADVISTAIATSPLKLMAPASAAAVPKNVQIKVETFAACPPRPMRLASTDPAQVLSAVCRADLVAKLSETPSMAAANVSAPLAKVPAVAPETPTSDAAVFAGHGSLNCGVAPSSSTSNSSTSSSSSCNSNSR
jgi:hypothetical protein